MKSIECVIDNADMWMFKFEHLKKNLAGYTYKDIVSSQMNVEVLSANFDVERSYEIIGLLHICLELIFSRMNLSGLM